MQVFATSSNLTKSAKVLDTRRLNKQIIECNQIYSALMGITEGWRNHCVTRLWRDHTTALMAFATECYIELKHRGYNPCLPKLFIRYSDLDEKEIPNFLHDSIFTNAMKSHLLAKDKHYLQFNWNVPAKSGYYALDKKRKFQMYSEK